MKKCYSCKKFKSTESFHQKADRCKECCKIYAKKYYQLNKQKLVEQSTKRRAEITEWFKSIKRQLKCSSCGYNKCISSLDFHHNNYLDKKYNLSCLGKGGASKKKILNEINNCNILCKNCHREFHYIENKSITSSTRSNKKYEIRQKIRKIKEESGCQICGYNSCSDALTFHHFNDKTEDISRMISQGCGLRKIKEEIDKCIILCSNCHYEIHDGKWK